MKVVQFLVLGTVGALFVACGAWALVWFSGVPISRTSISTQSDFKPLLEAPASKRTIVTGEKQTPSEPAPNRTPSLGKKDNDRNRQDWERELNKKINSICRGC
jgi:hypothetical protein